MGNLDVDTLENICDSFGESFGKGQDDQAMLIGLIHFLLPIQLVVIMNEISRAVISYLRPKYLTSNTELKLNRLLVWKERRGKGKKSL